MHKLAVLFMFVGVIGFTLSGCADKANPVETTATEGPGGSALGKAYVVTQSFKVEMDYYVDALQLPCLGEGIHMTGTSHFVMQTQYDGLGNWHATWHQNRQDMFGVSDGGTIYLQTGAITMRGNKTGQVGGVQHWAMTMNFVGQGVGAGNDFVATERWRYVVNANGVEVVEFEEVTADCKK